MFKIQNKQQLTVFAVTITLLAIVVTNFMNYYLLPPELFHDTKFVGSSIALILGASISLVVGRSYLRITRLSDELENLVAHDQLTGLWSRRRFFEYLEKEAKYPNSVAILDIDYFKSINDTHGHQAGDDALKNIARRLSDCGYPNAKVARLGGEEFGVIFVDISRGHALEILEDMRLQVETNHLILADESVQLTISGGIATAFDFGNLDRAMMAADAALYRAKSSGRNQIFLGT